MLSRRLARQQVIIILTIVLMLSSVTALTIYLFKTENIGINETVFVDSSFVLRNMTTETSTAVPEIEKWYLRNADSTITPCVEANKVLSQLPGTLDLGFQIPDSDLSCWLTPAFTKSFPESNWTLEIWMFRLGGSPPDPTIELRIEVVDVTGSVISQIILSRSQVLSSTTYAEFVFTEISVPMITLNNERLRLSAWKSSGGGRNPMLRIEGEEGGIGDSKIIIEPSPDGDDIISISLGLQNMDAIQHSANVTVHLLNITGDSITNQTIQTGTIPEKGFINLVFSFFGTGLIEEFHSVMIVVEDDATL